MSLEFLFSVVFRPGMHMPPFKNASGVPAALLSKVCYNPPPSEAEDSPTELNTGFKSKVSPEALPSPPSPLLRQGRCR